ncbi:MAG: transposase [Balneolaceae bacterium]
MGRSRYKFRENHYPYFITSSIIEGYSLFADPMIAEILLTSLDYMQQEKGVDVFAYVLMHNHIHLIAEHEELQDNLKKMKSFTARSIIDYLKKTNKKRWLNKLRIHKLSHHADNEFQVWQEGLHPKQVFNQQMMLQKIEYIHFNPVKAGFVSSPLHWRYSSVHNYEGKGGLIPVKIYGG